MECVSIATTSILVNGSPTEEFSLEKGLRQGDPLSPFLFLLTAEGLSVMMRAMVQSSLFTRYSVGSANSTVVFHLQFADDTLLLEKEHEGLEVRQMREFNTALLGKWCWRLLVDRGGMWYRVLASWYGEVAGRVEARGRFGFVWWREVAKIRDGEGRWFAESVERRVGNGVDTFFWTGAWLGGVPLSVRYRRLFDLSINKLRSVAAMCELGWEEGGAAWQWRRQLWAWEEEMLGECQRSLNDFVLQPNISDHWLWRHDIGAGFMVWGAYALLTTMDVIDTYATSDLIWHKQ
ncbi:cysteine-rich receptor-like protein kinase, partial [Trifolium pratense]